MSAGATRSGDASTPPDPSSTAQHLGVVARGGFAMGTSTVVVLLLAVPTTAILVRSLGVKAYGALAFALGLTALASTFADLGMANSIMRMSGFKEKVGEAGWARSGVALSLISGTVASAACVGIALSMAPPARTVLLTMSVLPLVLTLRSELAAHLRARRNIFLVEGSSALGQILYSGGAMALVALGLATAPLVSGVRVAAMVLITLLLLPRWLRLAPRQASDPGTWKRLLRFSIPLFVAGISWLVLQRSDVIMLGFFRGPGAVGIYSPILQVVNLCSVIMGVLGTYYLPVVSRLVADADMPGMRWLYATVTKWGVVLIAPFLAALIVVPGPIMQALFGPIGGTERASILTRILTVGYAAGALTGQNGYSLMALGRTRTIGIRSAIALVLNLGVNAFLIPRFGPVGAAIGTSVVYVGLNVANSFLIWRIAGLHPLRRDFVAVVGVAVALSLLSLGVVSASGWTHSLAGSLFTFFVVGAGSLVTWFVTSSIAERRSWLPRPFHRRADAEPLSASPMEDPAASGEP